MPFVNGRRVGLINRKSIHFGRSNELYLFPDFNIKGAEFEYDVRERCHWLRIDVDNPPRKVLKNISNFSSMPDDLKEFGIRGISLVNDTENTFGMTFSDDGLRISPVISSTTLSIVYELSHVDSHDLFWENGDVPPLRVYTVKGPYYSIRNAIANGPVNEEFLK